MNEVKFKLCWTDPSPPNGQDRWYDHVIATSPLGEFVIEWKSWKEYDSYTISLNGDYINTSVDLSGAKGLAQEYVRNKLLELIDFAESANDKNIDAAFERWFAARPDDFHKTVKQSCRKAFNYGVKVGQESVKPSLSIFTKTSHTELVKREMEMFDKQHPHFDLTKDVNGWGDVIYKHQVIQDMFCGWLARVQCETKEIS